MGSHCCWKNVNETIGKEWEMVALEVEAIFKGKKTLKESLILQSSLL